MVPRRGLRPITSYPLTRKRFFASSIKNVYQLRVPKATVVKAAVYANASFASAMACKVRSCFGLSHSPGK